MQVSFMGSRSTLWHPATFWRRETADPAAVHVLSLEPAGCDGGGSPSSPPPQRMPSQPGSHKLEALSALAQRSARTLWYASPLKTRRCLPPPGSCARRVVDPADIRVGILQRCLLHYSFWSLAEDELRMAR